MFDSDLCGQYLMKEYEDMSIYSMHTAAVYIILFISFNSHSSEIRVNVRLMIMIRTYNDYNHNDDDRSYDK